MNGNRSLLRLAGPFGLAGRIGSLECGEKVWTTYGMEQDAVWMVDASGKQERGGCCISMTLRDYARVGQFILDGGKARGRQVVPSWWVA
jgi:CubicO group peptidase (beta-lactamase class C family)